MTTLTKEQFAHFESVDQLSQFLHDCIDDLCRKNTSRTKENPSQESLYKSILTYYQEKATNDHHPVPSTLPENVNKALNEVFKLRQKDIINALVKNKLIASGHTLVENFDWKLKWILGSSKVATLREPVCQVELNCLSQGADSRPLESCMNFECDLEAVKKLISVLTSVKKELSNA